MTDCPIKLVPLKCDRCPFSKESLCDYPHAVRKGNLEQVLFMSILAKTRLIEPGDVWRQSSKN